MKTLNKFMYPLEHLCVPPFENHLPRWHQARKTVFRYNPGKNVDQIKFGITEVYCGIKKKKES